MADIVNKEETNCDETKEENPASAVHYMNVDTTQGNSTNMSKLQTISYSPLNVKQQFLLTEGLTSEIRDDINGKIIASKVFVRHWKPIFWFLYVVVTSFIDLRFNTSWVYSMIILLTHIAVIIFALYVTKFPRNGIKYTSKTHNSTQFRIYHIADKANRWHWQKSKEKNGIVYPTGICWMFGIVNNWHLLDCWWLWINPAFGAYISFGQMIINAYWGDKPSMLGCPTFSEAEVQSGHCFLANQWGILVSIMAAMGLGIASLFFCDISQFAIDTVRAAQNQAETIVNSLPEHDSNKSTDSFDDPYYKCLKHSRSVPSTFNSKKVQILAWFVIMLLSIHLLFWEFGTNSFGVIVPITNKKTQTVVIILYLLIVPMFMFVFHFIFLTLKSIYLPYRDLKLIMKVFAYPLAVKTLDELMVWWHLRCFYIYYVMPIYYRYGNALFFAYIVCMVLIWTIIIFWSFVYGVNIYHMDATIGISLFLGLVITFVLVIIAFVIANIYPAQQSHLKMLKKEFLKICSDKESGGITDESTELCKTIMALISDHDVQPKVMGVIVSVYKIYLFVGYALSSTATIIFNNSDIFLKKE